MVGICLSAVGEVCGGSGEWGVGMGGRRTKGGWCVVTGRNVKDYIHIMCLNFIYNT